MGGKVTVTEGEPLPTVELNEKNTAIDGGKQSIFFLGHPPFSKEQPQHIVN